MVELRSLRSPLLVLWLSACRADPDAAGGVHAQPDDGGSGLALVGDGGSADGGADGGEPGDGGETTDGGGQGDGGGATDPCARAGVLVYGPTDLAGAEMLGAAGFEVTVWSAEQWSAASTADFAHFALVVVGEQSCDGPDPHGEFDALQNSQAAWGPAIEGRVMLSGLDIQCHSADWETTATGDPSVPPKLFANAVAWLTDGCGTAMMVDTGWGRREGDHIAVLGYFEEVSQRGDKVTIEEADHPLFDGIAATGLDNWGSTFHSLYTAWPDDYRSVATGNGGAGVVLLRESTLE